GVEIAASFDGTEQRMVERTSALQQVFADADNAILGRTQRTAALLEERAGAIADSLSGADQRLAASAGAISARIDDSITGAEQRLGAGADLVGERLQSHLTQVEAELVARANAISDTFISVNQQIGLGASEAAAAI